MKLIFILVLFLVGCTSEPVKDDLLMYRDYKNNSDSISCVTTNTGRYSYTSCE